MKNKNQITDNFNLGKFTRRNFLKLSIVGSFGFLFLQNCRTPKSESSWRFFTDEEAKLVDAITEQIIPTDEWSGAKKAGVTNYIDMQLKGPYSRYQGKYRKGLEAVELSCKQIHSQSFLKLSWDEQTSFLKKMESGELSQLKSDVIKPEGKKLWENEQDKELFQLLRDHTMQGFYGSPRHGGNKDYVSYRMIGLDYPLVIGQNRYKN